MSFDENDMMYGMGEGCPYHGEQFMQECSMCGAEYCARCHAGSVCPECAEAQAQDEDESDSSVVERNADDSAVGRAPREVEEFPADGAANYGVDDEEDR